MLNELRAAVPVVAVELIFTIDPPDLNVIVPVVLTVGVVEYTVISVSLSMLCI